jgi:hypothetical protein
MVCPDPDRDPDRQCRGRSSDVAGFEIDPDFDCPDPHNQFPKPITRSHPAAIAPCQQQITPFKMVMDW